MTIWSPEAGPNEVTLYDARYEDVVDARIIVASAMKMRGRPISPSLPVELLPWGRRTTQTSAHGSTVRTGWWTPSMLRFATRPGRPIVQPRKEPES